MERTIEDMILFLEDNWEGIPMISSRTEIRSLPRQTIAQLYQLLTKTGVYFV
jgi:hypothetical protein